MAPMETREQGMNTSQSKPVMDALCQVVRTHLPLSLHSLLDATTLALKEQRIQAASNTEEQGYIDFLRLCSSLRERAQNETVQAICNQLLGTKTSLMATEPNLSEWNLVDDAEVDEMLEARRIVRQLREPLGTLEWQACGCVNSLTEQINKDPDNALSLEFLLRSLQARLHLRQQSAGVREVFYRCCMQVLGHALQAYYQQLNTVFSQFQITPKAESFSSPSARHAQTHRAAPSVSHSDAPYQAIQQLRRLDTSSPAPAAVAAAPLEQAQLQHALEQLQTTPSPPQGWSAQGFLRALQAAGIELSVRQADDAGLVADLFQHIEQEAVIAPSVKPALRRLMVPVAQAAILDPAAFADPTHPVRSSLDKMMRLCDFAEPANTALDQRVEQLIDGIVNDYQGDSAVFSRCDKQLDQLLNAQQRAYRNNAERVLQYHRGRDKLVQARLQVTRSLALLFGAQAPKVLIDWLDVGWHELMVQGLLRQGDDGREWQDDLDVIRQLNTWLSSEANHAMDEAEQVERAYEVDQVLELLRRRTESLLPGQYRHKPILQQLQLQLSGQQAIQYVQLPPLPAESSPPTVDPQQQRWHDRVQQLNSGDWLVTDQGQSLQLVWANPASDHFVLANRQGHEVGSFTQQQLMQLLADGKLGSSTADSPGVIEEHLQNIVGKLYRDIAHVRSHDELTGLYNRSSFEACVAQTLAEKDNYAFIYGHVDQFSLLNSSCGPLAGDTYLKQLADLLSAQLPANATLARIGAADFAVALPRTAGGQAYRVAESLCKAVEATPFVWQEQAHSITMSLGLVLTSDRHDVVNIFCDLQTACNAAKQDGRNRVHIYDDSADSALHNLMAIAARVDGIVERGELSMRMQQIAPAKSNHTQLPHYELLLVMENEIRLIDFITAAERYNRMTKVDRWVLKRAFSELGEHPEVWTRVSGVSINLSGSSLNDDKLLGFIESLFEQYPVPPERICFELTETAAVANLTKTADFVRHLQKIGCTFSIDDFGTGFSSYDYLKRLPVDFVKIDGSFVKEIERSPSDLAMVKSINEIAHVLGRKTIAEYVETPSIRARLAELGIDYVQGYGVEEPRPLSEYLAVG